MTGYHTVWQVPEEHRERPGYRAAGLRIALAEAVYARRTTLGLSAAGLAAAAGVSEDLIERIEESDVDPTLELIETLASALDVAVHLDPDDDRRRLSFEPHAA